MLHKSALSVALILGVSTLPLCTPCAVAQDKLWRIGFLDLSVPPTAARPSRNLEAFQQGLDGLGYSEGRNYIIEAQFADTDRSRLPALAKELVDRGVDVIVAIGAPTFHHRRRWSRLPLGARPAGPAALGVTILGNVAGFTHTRGEFAGKAATRDAAPNISRIAILADDGTLEPPSGGASSAAKDLELTLLLHDVNGVKSETEFDSILSKIVEERADALFVFPDFVNNKYEKAILDFTSANRLPSMGQNASFVERGGLMYYYTNWSELRRRAAAYVDRIFKGTKPADLPVEQPSRFEFIVNMKTAEALGLTIPRSVLALADKVIE
jgi:putative ABC transport system substrate-binding protein